MFHSRLIHFRSSSLINVIHQLHSRRHVYLARGQKCKQMQSSYYGSRKHARYNIAIMVVTKRCAWGECKNDTRYPHLLKNNQNNDPAKFYCFTGPYDRPKDEENGQSHVTEAIILFAVKTAVFAVYISLATMDQRKGFKYN